MPIQPDENSDPKPAVGGDVLPPGFEAEVKRFESHSTIGQPKRGQAGVKKVLGSVIVVDPSPLSLLTLAGILYHEGYECICARTASAAIEASQSGQRDLVVWDVSADAPGAIAGVDAIRKVAGNESMPVVFIADQRWVGLEKKTESMKAPSRCLFKPIDPASLTAIVQQTLWLPSLLNAHHRRSSKPSRPGWVTLD